MKKIAILSGYHFHNECIGFLCSLLDSYEIFIFYKDNSLSWLDYYNHIFKNLKIYIFNDDQFNYNDYDFIFKISAGDSIIDDPNANKKTIAISHYLKHVDNSKLFISLHPENISEKIHYILPIYNGILYKEKFENTITFIGYFKKEFFDNDLQNFIKNSKYIFNFISWNEVNNDFFLNFDNIIHHKTLNTHDMLVILLKSKFILSRKIPYQNKDQFTGIINLAISHRKPLIIQKELIELYKFPALVFEENFCELIDKLNNMNDEEYYNLVNHIDSFCNETITKNKITMQQILDKI
jgi:hypothetical protein